MSDESLCKRIKKGEKDAFQTLFEKYAPKIYTFSLTYLKNRDDTDELVQNVFLKIWEKRSTLDSTQNLKAFIFKIAVNTIYDFIRRKNIERAFEDYAKLKYTTNENYTWHTVIFEEMKNNLNKLISQLPEKQKKIFQLSKLEGLTNDEIAHQLNLSKRTVENHLCRALTFLKKHFKNESFFTLLFFYLFCA